MLEDYQDEINRLARRVRATRAKHRRYLPPDLRQALGGLARRLSEDGVSPARLAGLVGVTAPTLGKYMAVRDVEAARPVPVLLEDRIGEAAGVTLVAPSGWRLENLDARTAVALIRELA